MGSVREFVRMEMVTQQWMDDVHTSNLRHHRKKKKKKTKRNTLWMNSWDCGGKNCLSATQIASIYWLRSYCCYTSHLLFAGLLSILFTFFRCSAAFIIFFLTNCNLFCCFAIASSFLPDTLLSVPILPWIFLIHSLTHNQHIKSGRRWEKIVQYIFHRTMCGAFLMHLHFIPFHSISALEENFKTFAWMLVGWLYVYVCCSNSTAADVFEEKIPGPCNIITAKANAWI